MRSRSISTNLSVPLWLAPLAIAGVFLEVGPLMGLITSMPWAKIPSLFESTELRQAIALSFGTALASTLVCVVIGLPMALWLHWARRKTQRLVGTFAQFLRIIVKAIQVSVYAPLVLSPVISGLAMITFWGRRGVVGSLLGSFGISIAYTTLGVVMVQVFVSLPFFVAMCDTGLAAVPRQLEESAATEGAGRREVLRYIVMPLVAPSMAAGGTLCFARALSEFGATITFAGNISGETQTIPLLVSLGLSSGDMDLALGATIFLLGIYLFPIGSVIAIRSIKRMGDSK